MSMFPDHPPTSPPVGPPTAPLSTPPSPPSAVGGGVGPTSRTTTPQGSGGRSDRSSTRRTVGGALLVLLAGISATLGFTAFWAQHEILDTGTWVATSRAIVDDPTVQRDVATSIAEQIVDTVGVENLVQSTLPAPFNRLSGVLADQATNLLTTAAEKVVATDAFTQVWDDAVRAVHDEFVHAVDGKTGLTAIGENGLYLQVGPALDQVRAQLVKMGVPLLDRVDLSNIGLQVLLVDAPGLDRIQTWVHTLRIAVIVFPAIAVIALLVGLVVARRRAVAIAAGGIGLLLGTGLVMLVMSSQESRAIDEISGGLLGRSSARVIVDQITSGLDRALVVTTILGLGIAVLGIVMTVMGRNVEARIASAMEESISGDGTAS